MHKQKKKITKKVYMHKRFAKNKTVYLHKRSGKKRKCSYMHRRSATTTKMLTP